MADIHSLPFRPRKRPPREYAAVQWVCRVCEVDLGVATSELIETITAPMIKRGKVVDGHKRYICRHCLARGKTTVAP